MELLGNLPYLLRPQYSDARQEAVVLVVVGHNDVAPLLLRQDKLHIVLDVGSRLNESGINVAGREVDDVETVLQLAHYADNLLVRLLFLIDGNQLSHAERRNIEFLACQREQVVQAVCVLLVAGVTAVASHKDIGVYEYVVRIEFECLLRHRSEYEIGELGLLLFREFIHLASHPDTEQEVNEFLTLESVLL